MRYYTYKKKFLDAQGTFEIERWKSENGIDCFLDCIVLETEKDYQDWILENDPEIIDYVFSDFNELKNQKILSLKNQATEKIYTTQFIQAGHPKNGKFFDAFNQNNTALGVSGFDEDFRYALNKYIKDTLALLEQKILLINNLTWNEELSDLEKQALIDQLNLISI
jgi:hypothetical protein